MLNPAVDDQLAVKRMYEKYPYPSANVGDSLIFDLASIVGFVFPGDDLRGKRILDLGCGSGHRLVGLAKQFPDGRFTGLDLSENSLKTALQLVEKYEANNVQLVNESLTEYVAHSKYDLIVSTGVLHHLEHPQQGFNQLSVNLKDDGMCIVWLYHMTGEYERLLSRELAHIMKWSGGAPISELDILENLQLDLTYKQYGTDTSHQREQDVSRDAINMDAFLHPIVYAYRFEEAFELMNQAGLTWYGIHGVNRKGESKMLDLQRKSADPFFYLQPDELFTSDVLVKKYHSLSKMDKLKVIELSWRPTGFTCIGGKGGSFSMCDEIVFENLVRRT